MSTSTIVTSMTSKVRAFAGAPQTTATPPCDNAFKVDDFDVTYINQELIANVEVTAVPPKAQLLGVTIAVSPTATSKTVYCMGVASDAGGVKLPISVLAASTSPVFDTPTQVLGIVVLSYSLDGANRECLLSQPFTVGVQP